MGLFSIFRRRRPEASGSTFSAYDLWQSSLWSPPGAVLRTSSAGEPVTQRTALSVPNYFACLNNRSEDGAKPPIRLRRKRAEGGADTDEGHAAAKVLRQPNPLMSEFTFRRTLQHYALGWGNGYAEIVRDNMGRPVELWPIHPARIVPKLQDDGRTLIYEWRPDFQTTVAELGPRDVLHLKGLGDGISGYSVLQFHADSVGIAQAAQKYAGAFFAEGSSKRLVAVVKEALTPEGREGLRKRIMGDRESNPVGSRKIPILEGDVSIVEAGIAPADAQFLESRMFQIEEIARWFRMPLSQIQHSTRAKGWATNEQEFTWYVNGALMTDAHVWEQELALKLLDDRDRASYFFAFDFSQLLRGDSAARMAYYNTALQSGILTRNEVRMLEGFNPSDEDAADVLTVNSATAVLETIMPKDEPEEEPEPDSGPGDMGGDPEPDPAGDPDADPEGDDGAEDDDQAEDADAGDESEGDEGGESDDEDERARRRRRAERGAARSALDSLGVVFRDVAERLVTKEQHALTRAIKRNGKNPAAFEKWAGTFGDRFAGEIAAGFAGAQEAAAQIVEAGGWAVDRAFIKAETAAAAALAVGQYGVNGDGLRSILGGDSEDRIQHLAGAAMGAVVAAAGGLDDA